MATDRDITAHLLAEDGVTAVRFAGDAHQLTNVDPFTMHGGDVLQFPAAEIVDGHPVGGVSMVNGDSLTINYTYHIDLGE